MNGVHREGEGSCEIARTTGQLITLMMHNIPGSKLGTVPGATTVGGHEMDNREGPKSP